MSIKKLSDSIRERALLLAEARADGDKELVEKLEDELDELQQQLEEELAAEYDDHHGGRDFV